MNKLYINFLKGLFVVSLTLAQFPYAMGQGTIALQGLGGLDQGGQSTALDISANGRYVVGFYTDALFNKSAFRWSLDNNEFMTIDGLQEAVGISADGSKLVGYNQMGFQFNSFKWTEGEGLSGIGDIPGGDALGIARGISDDGNRFAGESSSSNGLEAFLQIDGGLVTGLGDLPGGTFNSAAYDISGDGNTIIGKSVVGGSDIEQPFRWSLGTGISALGLLPGYEQGIARDANTDATFIVGANYGGNGAYSKEAFIWAPGGIQGLGVLDNFHFSSEAFGISEDGLVVVGTNDDNNAFIWTPANGMKFLKEVLNDLGADTEGWTLQIAHDVSADGCTIVGKGVNPNGQIEAFIAFLGCQTTAINDQQVPINLALKTTPNPFSTETVISFNLFSNTLVDISVYNTAGKKVAELAHQKFSSGDHFITWNGKNQNGQDLSTGIYYAIIKTKDFIANQKIVRLK